MSHRLEAVRGHEEVVRCHVGHRDRDQRPSPADVFSPDLSSISLRKGNSLAKDSVLMKVLLVPGTRARQSRLGYRRDEKWGRQWITSATARPCRRVGTPVTGD